MLGEHDPGTPTPEPIAPLPTGATLDHLASEMTITFDRALDPASTVLASQFRFGDGVTMYSAFGTVAISGTTVTVSIITPAGTPSSYGAWLIEGAGQLLGIEGGVVAPFGPVGGTGV